MEKRLLNNNSQWLKRVSRWVPNQSLWVAYELPSKLQKQLVFVTREVITSITELGAPIKLDCLTLTVDDVKYILTARDASHNDLMFLSSNKLINTLPVKRITDLEGQLKKNIILVPEIGTEDGNLNLIAWVS